MSLVDKVLRGTKSKMVRTFVDEKEADRRYAICFGDDEFFFRREDRKVQRVWVSYG